MLCRCCGRRRAAKEDEEGCGVHAEMRHAAVVASRREAVATAGVMRSTRAAATPTMACRVYGEIVRNNHAMVCRNVCESSCVTCSLCSCTCGRWQGGCSEVGHGCSMLWSRGSFVCACCNLDYGLGFRAIDHVGVYSVRSLWSACVYSIPNGHSTIGGKRHDPKKHGQARH
jgi:hypothetical protein